MVVGRPCPVRRLVVYNPADYGIHPIRLIIGGRVANGCLRHTSGFRVRLRRRCTYVPSSLDPSRADIHIRSYHPVLFHPSPFINLEWSPEVPVRFENRFRRVWRGGDRNPRCHVVRRLVCMVSRFCGFRGEEERIDLFMFDVFNGCCVVRKDGVWGELAGR